MSLVAKGGLQENGISRLGRLGYSMGIVRVAELLQKAAKIREAL